MHIVTIKGSPSTRSVASRVSSSRHLTRIHPHWSSAIKGRSCRVIIGVEIVVPCWNKGRHAHRWSASPSPRVESLSSSTTTSLHRRRRNTIVHENQQRFDNTLATILDGSMMFLFKKCSIIVEVVESKRPPLVPLVTVRKPLASSSVGDI